MLVPFESKVNRIIKVYVTPLMSLTLIAVGLIITDVYAFLHTAVRRVPSGSMISRLDLLFCIGTYSCLFIIHILRIVHLSLISSIYRYSIKLKLGSLGSLLDESPCPCTPPLFIPRHSSQIPQESTSGVSINTSPPSCGQHHP